jgi:hypothetical protein
LESEFFFFFFSFFKKIIRIIVIITANGGYQFGVYNPIGFKRNSTWEATNKSFIFSLSNGKSRPPKKFKVKIPNASNAIYQDPTNILHFGGSDLLVIYDKQSNNSYFR